MFCWAVVGATWRFLSAVFTSKLGISMMGSLADTDEMEKKYYRDGWRLGVE